MRSLVHRASLWLLGVSGAILLAPAMTIASAQATETVIGIAAPTTGRFAAIGAAIVRTVEDALERLDVAMPITRAQIVLRIEDDGCTGAGGAAAAKALLLAGAVVVIGHPCGSAAAAAAKAYEDHGTGPVVLLLSRHPAAGRQSTAQPLRIFRAAGRDDAQGAAIAAYLSTTADKQRVAVVHDRTRYASAIAAEIAKRLGAAGRPVVLTSGLVAGEKDYANVIGAVLQVNADAMVFAGYPIEAALLVRELRLARSSTEVVLTDAAHTAELTRLPPVALNGVRIALPWAPDLNRNRNSLSAAASTPQDSAELAARYASLSIDAWLQAVSRIGSTDPLTIAAALSGGADAGTARPPPLRFTANGEAILPSFALYQWDTNRLVRAAP